MNKAPKLPPRPEHLAAEKKRRELAAPASKRPLLMKRLFREQLDLIEDLTQFKVATCSRRAGKTFCVSSMLIDTAMKFPRCRALYITLTRHNAKQLVWDDPDSGLLALNDSLELGGEANNSTLELTLPNGSVICLMGCDTQREVRKARGKKYRLVVIDEAQDFSDDVLDDLLKNVLPKTLQDLRGQLVLTGTPGQIASGPFFEISTGKHKKWKAFYWTQLENVFFPECIELIKEGRAKTHAEAVALMRQKELDENDWSEETPAYQRETLGLWFTDYDALLFRYDPRKNSLRDIDPPAELVWQHAMGIDVGFKDATAFVVWAYNEKHRIAYCVHDEKKPRMLMPDVRERALVLFDQFSVSHAHMDPSAGGPALIAELQDVYGLAVEAADKSPGAKATMVEMMNADLAAGKIRVDPEGPLAREWKSLRRDPKTGIEMQTKKDVCDCSDAALYGYQLVSKFRGRPAPVSEKNPDTVSSDWFADQEDERAERAHSSLDYGQSW